MSFGFGFVIGFVTGVCMVVAIAFAGWHGDDS